MRLPRRIGLIAIVVVAALGAGSVAATQGGPAPITVTARPNRTPVGGRVGIEGTTAFISGKTVQLEVLEPDGQSRRLSIPVLQTGQFMYAYMATGKPGLHRVSATAPDGVGRDTSSFTVLSGVQTVDEVAFEWEDDADDLDSAVTVVKKLVDTLPASPVKDEVQKKLDQLDKRLQQRARDVANFKKSVGALQQILTKHPSAAPAITPTLHELTAWVQQSEEERVELNRRLLQSAKESVVCEKINAAGEGIKVASAILNLAGTPLGILNTFFRDWLADKAQSSLPNNLKSNSAFALSTQEIVKNGRAANDAIVDYGSTAMRAKGAGLAMIPGILFDLTSLLTDQVFGKYCEKFEGPMDADLHVEFLHASGKVWWTYDIALQGKLTVRYGKAATSAAKVKGEFVGSATQFKMWEDALRVFNPALMDRTMVWKRSILPTAAPFVAFEGSYAGALGPSGFFVPVEGDLIDRKLSLRVLPARSDFEGKTARVIWVLGGQRTVGLPLVMTQTFPYRGAYTVLKGGLTGVFNAPEFESNTTPTNFTVKNAGKTLVVDETVEQDKVKGNGFIVTTRVRIKACNPGCS